MSNSSNNQLEDGGTDFETDADEDWRVVSLSHYDPVEAHDLTSTIIYAIADVEQLDPVDLKNPALYDCIDVSAIEHSLFGPNRGREKQNTGSIQFAFGDYRISVQSDGWVLVYESV